MRRVIKASIDISAPPEVVWRVLMDFSNYEKWSKFLLSIKGHAIPGSYLRTLVVTTEGRPHLFKLLVLQVVPQQTFLTRLGIPGLFGGEHGFTLEYKLGGHTRVRQTGEFAGLFMPILWRRFESPVTHGIKAFNRALKRQAESMH